MATPVERIDPTAGLRLVTQAGLGREENRFLFMAGDVLAPERKRQRPHLRNGGEEVPSPCLRRTPNYVERCSLTPLETWFEPIGLEELVPEGVRPVYVQSEAQNIPMPEFTSPQVFRQNTPMIGIQHYPGEDLPLIIEVAGIRGIFEITSLRGKEWESGEVQAIQREFFPEEAPVALRLVEDRIREVGRRGGIYGHVAEEAMEACGIFRFWALERINKEHGWLATRKEHQFVYTYSRLAPQLLAQLEMQPRDSGSEAREIGKAIAQEIITAQQTQNVPANAPFNIEAIIDNAVKAALQAHGIGVPPAEGSYQCENCDHVPFKTQAGLEQHARQWCKGPQEQE
jgi:hypothetical protein